MPDAKTYQGGCHCGKVRYQVTTDLARVISCNCSICSKKAHLLTFVGTDAFQLLQGEDNLTDYQFNTKNIHHVFCRTCGIQSFARGTNREGMAMFSVNVRCLDDVDPATVAVTAVDGRSR
ncbi:MAG TPA: GFA family protein [Polyangia bacterium]